MVSYRPLALLAAAVTGGFVLGFLLRPAEAQRAYSPGMPWVMEAQGNSLWRMNSATGLAEYCVLGGQRCVTFPPQQ